jgi:hypothetical protein
MSIYTECWVKEHQNLFWTTIHEEEQIPVLVKKSKAVPLHAMEAPGGRRGIAPTHT